MFFIITWGSCQRHSQKIFEGGFSNFLYGKNGEGDFLKNPSPDPRQLKGGKFPNSPRLRPWLIRLLRLPLFIPPTDTFYQFILNNALWRWRIEPFPRKFIFQNAIESYFFIIISKLFKNNQPQNKNDGGNSKKLSAHFLKYFFFWINFLLLLIEIIKIDEFKHEKDDSYVFNARWHSYKSIQTRRK